MAAMPTLTDTGERYYDSVASLATRDEEFGWPLAALSAALAAMKDGVAAIVRDPDDPAAVPAWANRFDVDTVEPEWLPWLSQFVGADLTSVSDVPTQRTLIKNPVGYNRGSTEAMIAFVKATLTGTKTVLINERVGGDAWKMTVATYTSETPNPEFTRQAILSQKRAGIVLTYSVVTGGDYATLAASHGSYSVMEAAHTTYADIPTNPAA